MDAAGDMLTGRQAQWVKTVRFDRSAEKAEEPPEPAGVSGAPEGTGDDPKTAAASAMEEK